MTGGDCSVVELVRWVPTAYGRDDDLSGAGDAGPAELTSADRYFGSLAGMEVIHDSFGRLTVVPARRRSLGSALGSGGKTIVNIPRHLTAWSVNEMLSRLGGT